MYQNSNFVSTGLCMTFYHQQFQIVKLIILYCNYIIKGLNPYVFLQEQLVNDKNAMKEAISIRENKIQKRNKKQNYRTVAIIWSKK